MKVKGCCLERGAQSQEMPSGVTVGEHVDSRTLNHRITRERGLCGVSESSFVSVSWGPFGFTRGLALLLPVDEDSGGTDFLGLTL